MIHLHPKYAKSTQMFLEIHDAVRDAVLWRMYDIFAGKAHSFCSSGACGACGTLFCLFNFVAVCFDSYM